MYLNAIETIGLEHVYADGTAALQGVDFKAGSGEKIAVLGANGSGKSTLFYHFNGLIKPSRGTIRVFGEEICKNNVDAIRRRVGMVFQEPETQLFAPTVYEDVAFGPSNLGIGRTEIEERVKDVLNRFEIRDIAQKNPANLSAGQKKRVAVAGIVAMEPDVLVLDEPTTGLDAPGVTNIMELLDELNGEGKTIIMSTHDSDLAAAWADRIYVLNKGRVLRQGEPKDIFAKDNLIAEAGLKHPLIVQTFREFRARGISKGEVPLSVLELMESIDAKVMNVRCAVAGCDVLAGDEVFLGIKDGMLVAERCGTGMKGKAAISGRKGDDIAVKDVTGDMKTFSGKITIIRVPGIAEGGTRAADVERVREILNRSPPGKIAAMGTSAKVLAGRMNLKCDIEFDVIQSCILAALRGFDVIVFASGGMAERAAEKVKEKNIPYEKL